MIDTLAVTIAIRHIISRRRQTILSVLTVALAVSISVIFTSHGHGSGKALHTQDILAGEHAHQRAGWRPGLLARPWPGQTDIPTSPECDKHGQQSGVLIVARPEYFVYAVVFAPALNFIAGIYPAYTATRLDPVEAIASE